jgi:hypothetical protein
LEETINAAALEQSCDDPLDELGHDVADDDDREEADEPWKPDEELIPSPVDVVGDDPLEGTPQVLSSQRRLRGVPDRTRC